MAISLPVLNLSEATFECTFGRGCEGICCQTGRPMFYPEDIDRVGANLSKFLPEMRPEARAVVEKQGYLTNRYKKGYRTARVTQGWCVFFNKGCVLHKVGADEGDKYRYKPIACALFPLARDEDDNWYVRQLRYKTEEWNLFCLDRNNSAMPAAQSLKDEIALALHQDPVPVE
jgi:hypothetical protein